MNSFSRAVASRQQLLFQNSYFIRSKLRLSSHFLRIDSCLGQYFVGTATFWVEKLVQKKDIYRRATFFKQVLPHRKKFFRTGTFSTKVLPQKRYFYRTATFWRKLIFFRKAIFHMTYFI